MPDIKAIDLISKQIKKFKSLPNPPRRFGGVESYKKKVDKVLQEVNKEISDVRTYVDDINCKLQELKAEIENTIEKNKEAINEIFGSLQETVFGNESELHYAVCDNSMAIEQLQLALELEKISKNLINDALHGLIAKTELLCAKVNHGITLTEDDIAKLHAGLDNWKNAETEVLIQEELILEEKRRKDEELKAQREAEERKEREREEERQRKEELEKRRREKEEERRRNKEEERRRNEEEKRRRTEEENRWRIEEENRRRNEEEQLRRNEEEERRRIEEEERRRIEEEERRRIEEEEERRRNEEEKRRRNEERKRRRIEEKKRRLIEEEKRRRIEEERRLIEEEKRRLIEEELKRVEEEEEKLRTEENKRRLEEQMRTIRKERQRKAAEEQKRREEEEEKEEKKRLALEQLRRQTEKILEADRQKKDAKEKRRRKKEMERRRLAEEERRRKEEEKRLAEEERRQKEEDKRLAEVERRRKEEEGRLAEEESRRKEEERRLAEEQKKRPEWGGLQTKRWQQEGEEAQRGSSSWIPIVYNREDDGEVDGRRIYHCGVKCILTCSPGDITKDDLECFASDEVDSVIEILEDEETPISSLIELKSKSGSLHSKLPSRLYIPHYSELKKDEEILMKASVDGRDWITSSPVPCPSDLSEQETVLNLAGVEINDFTSVQVMVVCRPRCQTVVTDEQCVTLTSTMDKTFSLFFAKEDFPRKDGAQTDEDRRIGKIYQVYSCGNKVWELANTEFKRNKDVVSVNLPSGKRKYVVMEVKVNDDYPEDKVPLLVKTLHECINTTFVRMIVRQKDEEHDKCVVRVVRDDQCQHAISFLNDCGFTIGPDVSAPFIIQEGHHLKISFFGNIEAIQEMSSFGFLSYLGGVKADLTLKVKDTFKQKDLPVYVGNAICFVLDDRGNIQRKVEVAVSLPKNK